MSSIAIRRHQDPAAVDRILRSLPEWFGIEEAIATYVANAEHCDSFLAITGETVVGVALITRHFHESAELSLIAVHADFRGAGVGFTLLEAISSSLVKEDCQLLQVHTVGPSFEDAAYAQTRSFYERAGFLPLQEFDRIDWDGPSLVLVKPLK